MILQTSHNPAEDLQKCESKIKQKMIKGIIMLSSPADESFFAQLDKYDIPVVVIGKVEGQYAHVYSVDTDNFGDSIALTDALIESGHQNIACLHAPLDVHVSVDRVNGYKQSWLRIILQCVMNGLLTAVIPMKQHCKPRGNY